MPKKKNTNFKHAKRLNNVYISNIGTIQDQKNAQRHGRHAHDRTCAMQASQGLQVYQKI